MKKLIAVFLIGSGFTSIAFAQNPAPKAESYYNCGHFNIQIANLTDTTCVLSNIAVIHGNLISSPPAVIRSNHSHTFNMDQTMIGPEVTLSYQCGSESISFSSKQDVCLMKAGNITGKILHPESNTITTSYTVLTGSYFWGTPGRINWSILKTN